MWSLFRSSLARLTGAGMLLCVATAAARAYDQPGNGAYGPPSGGSPSYGGPQAQRYYAGTKRDLDGPGGAAYAVAPPAPIWTGLYLGLHGGYDIGSARFAGIGGADLDGSALGLHLGYNWQSGNWVYGVETDATLSWATGGSLAGGFLLESEAGARASLRARAGYAFNNVLLYGTAGFGLAGMDAGMLGAHTSAAFPAFVVGGGVEWRLSAPVSLRLEALYWGVGERGVEFGFGRQTIDGDFTTIRAGLTFHFR